MHGSDRRNMVAAMTAARLRELGVADDVPATGRGDGAELRQTAAQLGAARRLPTSACSSRVLLVGFAYVWKRGDLDWVRALTRERAAAGASTAAAAGAGAESVDLVGVMHESAGAGDGPARLSLEIRIRSMAGPAFVDQLKAKFGDKIAGSNLENIDPWIEVTPDGLLEVCRYLRDEPTLAFDYLNCISGVDYLHTDEKKAAKSEWQPHTEVVYHLFSMKHKHSLVLKVMLPRWKNDKPGELPSAERLRPVEHGRLARARSVRPVRRLLHRPSESAAHPLPGRLGRPSAAQRLRDAARVPRNSRKVVRSIMSTAVEDPRIIEFDVRTDEMLVNMGPQHPSTHGVLRLVLRTDGEIVSEVDAAHRLPAPLRRKDRREPHAAAVDSVHRPHGLPGRDEHESRLVAGGREADGLPRAGTRPASARADLRAEPHRQPPGRHGRVRPRPRHVQPVPVRLPRAREDSRPVRGSLRRSAHLQLPHARRRDGRPAARLAAEVRGVPRPVRADHRRSTTRC